LPEVGSGLKGMFFALVCLMSLDEALKFDPLDPKFSGGLETGFSLLDGLE
jgi:hypothetical protein